MTNYVAIILLLSTGSVLPVTENAGAIALIRLEQKAYEEQADTRVATGLFIVDPTLVALADAVDAKGTASVLGPRWLRALGIPYSGTAAVAVKRITVRRHVAGNEVVKTITVVVTDKRYLSFMNTIDAVGYGTAIDENGQLVGSFSLDTDELVSLGAGYRPEFALKNTAFWVREIFATSRGSE